MGGRTRAGVINTGTWGKEVGNGRPRRIREVSALRVEDGGKQRLPFFIFRKESAKRTSLP